MGSSKAKMLSFILPSRSASNSTNSSPRNVPTPLSSRSSRPPDIGWLLPQHELALLQQHQQQQQQQRQHKARMSSTDPATPVAPEPASSAAEALLAAAAAAAGPAADAQGSVVAPGVGLHMADTILSLSNQVTAAGKALAQSRNQTKLLQEQIQAMENELAQSQSYHNTLEGEVARLKTKLDQRSVGMLMLESKAQDAEDRAKQIQQQLAAKDAMVGATGVKIMRHDALVARLAQIVAAASEARQEVHRAWQQARRDPYGNMDVSQALQTSIDVLSTVINLKAAFLDAGPTKASSGSSSSWEEQQEHNPDRPSFSPATQPAAPPAPEVRASNMLRANLKLSVLGAPLTSSSSDSGQDRRRSSSSRPAAVPTSLRPNFCLNLTGGTPAAAGPGAGAAAGPAAAAAAAAAASPWQGQAERESDSGSYAAAYRSDSSRGHASSPAPSPRSSVSRHATGTPRQARGGASAAMMRIDAVNEQNRQRIKELTRLLEVQALNHPAPLSARRAGSRAAPDERDMLRRGRLSTPCGGFFRPSMEPQHPAVVDAEPGAGVESPYQTQSVEAPSWARGKLASYPRCSGDGIHTAPHGQRSSYGYYGSRRHTVSTMSDGLGPRAASMMGYIERPEAEAEGDDYSEDSGSVRCNARRLSSSTTPRYGDQQQQQLARSSPRAHSSLRNAGPPVSASATYAAYARRASNLDSRDSGSNAAAAAAASRQEDGYGSPPPAGHKKAQQQRRASSSVATSPGWI